METMKTRGFITFVMYTGLIFGILSFTWFIAAWPSNNWSARSAMLVNPLLLFANYINLRTIRRRYE